MLKRDLRYFLILKPTRCTNFSNLFRRETLHVSDSFSVHHQEFFHCSHSNDICHTCLLCIQWKTPDGGQKNCPKYVEFYSKNKFEKLVHLVGFVIRIFHDARSPARKIRYETFLSNLLFISGWQSNRSLIATSLQAATSEASNLPLEYATVLPVFWNGIAPEDGRISPKHVELKVHK